MTSQQLADQLLAQWQLLWWAKPADRIRIIDEVRSDMIFENQLRLVTQEMEAA